MYKVEKYWKKNCAYIWVIITGAQQATKQNCSFSQKVLSFRDKLNEHIIVYDTNFKSDIECECFSHSSIWRHLEIYIHNTQNMEY